MDYRKILEDAIPSAEGGEWKTHDRVKFGAIIGWEGLTGECRVSEIGDGVWTGLIYIPPDPALVQFSVAGDFGAVLWYSGKIITTCGNYSENELEKGIHSAIAFGEGFLEGLNYSK